MCVGFVKSSHFEADRSRSTEGNSARSDEEEEVEKAGALRCAATPLGLRHSPALALNKVSCHSYLSICLFVYLSICLYILLKKSSISGAERQLHTKYVLFFRCRAEQLSRNFKQNHVLFFRCRAEQLSRNFKQNHFLFRFLFPDHLHLG